MTSDWVHACLGLAACPAAVWKPIRQPLLNVIATFDPFVRVAVIVSVGP